MNLNAAMVQLHNLLGQAQSNAGTVGTGGEKRNKDAVQHVGGNTAAVVFYLNNHPLLLIGPSQQANARVRGLGDCLRRIEHQIDEHLL